MTAGLDFGDTSIIDGGINPVADLTHATAGGGTMTTGP